MTGDPLVPFRSLAFAAASATITSAQQYIEEHTRLVPPTSYHTVVAADFDGDGDVDLACSELSTTLRFLWNDGSGRFVAGTQSHTIHSGVMAVGDVDGDGDPDLVVGGSVGFSVYAPGSLLRNDGGGQFTDVSAQWPSVNEATRRLALVDYDGDGDRDIVTCNRIVGQIAPVQPIHRLYLNNGAGVFTDVTAARLPNLPAFDECLAAGDLDGDGDCDLVFAGWGSTVSQPAPIRIRLQNALGVAVETSGLISPPVHYGAWTDVSLGDHDLDGDLDLAAASTQGVTFFANNGAAGFTIVATLPHADVYWWAPADVDRDGRVDLVAACRDRISQMPMPGRLYRNTPAGFVEATAALWEAAGLSPRTIAVADLDGDLDTDVIGASAPQLLLWHNDNAGRLLQLATPALGDVNVLWADTADVERDGDLDVAVIEDRSTSRCVVVAANDRGMPSGDRMVVWPWNNQQRAACLRWLDTDGDGDQDLFVGMSPGFDALFHRIGATFVDVTATHMPGTGNSKRVVAGDLDHDGSVDLLVAGYVVRFYRGNGVGGFADASALFPPSGQYLADDVAAIDFDADGDLDVVYALSAWYGTNGGLCALRNDLPAAFTDVTATLGLPTTQSRAVAAIDVDQDGQHDLLVGHNLALGTGVRLLRSTATGFIDETAQRLPVPLTSAGGFAVLDLDGDGDDDVVVRDQSETPAHVLRNDGGVFVVHPDPAFYWYWMPRRPAVGDFDRDGDQDLVARPGCWRNTARDLFVGLPARLGQTGELIVQARAGDGVNPQFVAFLLAAQALPTPLPLGSLGVLRLDPATISMFAWRSVPGSGGEASVSFLVPASPGLLGVRVFVQALYAHSPVLIDWRLGNLVELVVRT